MEELLTLGISENELKDMIETEPDITEFSFSELLENIKILQSINCDEKEIKNILISNPTYLCRNSSDILNLIRKLNELGFKSLNMLFDSNPFILNLDVFEIENYINYKIKNKEELEDIVNNLDSNPDLFNEI